MADSRQAWPRYTQDSDLAADEPDAQLRVERRIRNLRLDYIVSHEQGNRPHLMVLTAVKWL